MSLAILFHFLCAQRVSDINISIIRTKLSINKNHRLITLDIKDLYVNIPIAETIDIARIQLLKHNNPEITTQICRLLETILQQTSYFRNKFTNLTKEQRWAHLYQAQQRKYFYNTYNILTSDPSQSPNKYYTTHVTQTISSSFKLLITPTKTNWHNTPTGTIHQLAQYTNSMHNNQQFNPTQESNGHINFLDLTIRRRTSHL